MHWSPLLSVTSTTLATPGAAPLAENAPRRSSQDIGTPSYDDDDDDDNDEDDDNDDDDSDDDDEDDDADASRRILEGPPMTTTTMTRNDKTYLINLT